MKSIQLIDELERIHIDSRYSNASRDELLNIIYTKETTDCFIEAAMASEIGLMALFDARNVPDHYFDAFNHSFSNSNQSLYKHLLEIQDKGTAAELGFISNIKGKIFEFELIEKLEDAYPEYSFQIASNPTQTVFDIIGKTIDDSKELLVQAKMWDAGKSSILEGIMHENQDVLYATSREIREKIMENTPDLIGRFIPIDISNYSFTDDVKGNLDTLIGNHGIDVPDQLGDILPYITEIVLGIRLLLDIARVQKDYKNIKTTEKTKLSALKAIALLSRFGITTVCVYVASAAGGAIGGASTGGVGAAPGTIFGGLSGAVVAGILNKELKPIIEDVAIWLLGINSEDMFYYNNKARVDELAMAFYSSQKSI